MQKQKGLSQPDKVQTLAELGRHSPHEMKLSCVGGGPYFVYYSVAIASPFSTSSCSNAS